MTLLRISLFFGLIYPFSSFANLNHIELLGLSVDYQDKSGVGQVDKISLGFSRRNREQLVTLPYQISIEKTTDSYELLSQYVNINWAQPWPWAYELKQVGLDNFNLRAFSQYHFLTADKIFLKTKTDQDWQIREAEFSCQGISQNRELGLRLWGDCLDKMSVEIQKVYLPQNWKWVDEDWISGVDFLLDESPQGLKDFYFYLDKNQFSLNYRVKYLINSRIRVKGEVYKVAKDKMLKIKIIKASYGIIPATKILFNLLEKHVASENIEIKRPWIYIKNVE